MTRGRKLKLGFYSIALICACVYWYSVHFPSEKPTESISVLLPPLPPDTSRITEALSFCDSLGMNSDFAILMDLTTHSGNYRFFGVDLSTKDTVLSALVAHGHCKTTDHRLAQFSNEVGSNCSSLGRFRIGGKYTGSFGTSYKLHGLDSSNTNAFERFVVLHSHPCVPLVSQEDDICLSEGCPTIAPSVLEKLEPILDKSSQPVLLWIYQRQNL